MWGSNAARTDAAEPQPESQKGRDSRRRSKRASEGLTSFTELPYAEHWLRSAGSEAATTSSSVGYLSDSMTFSRRVQPQRHISPGRQVQSQKRFSEARGISWVESPWQSEREVKESPKEPGEKLGETRSDRSSAVGTKACLSSARHLSPASRLPPSEPVIVRFQHCDKLTERPSTRMSGRPTDRPTDRQTVIRKSSDVNGISTVSCPTARRLARALVLPRTRMQIHWTHTSDGRAEAVTAL